MTRIRVTAEAEVEEGVVPELAAEQLKETLESIVAIMIAGRPDTPVEVNVEID